MGDGCAGLFNKESGRTNGARVEGIRAEAVIRGQDPGEKEAGECERTDSD